ncbi:MAG: sigma-54 dependent transcriptional regulator [Smithellaceae bacterium]|nr:sigma-54 dependent transcriptional regulator [Smithellaceae bacterium]
MGTKKFNLSLLILLPLIFASISLLCVIVTYHLMRENPQPIYGVAVVTLWGVFAFAVTYLLGFLITWFVLQPTKEFVRKAERLPLFVNGAVGEPQARQDEDDLSHFSRIFQQVENILSKLEAKSLFPEIVGQSSAIRGILSQILKVAPTDSTVLIYGESGTGKELVANAIHEHSLRADKPYVKLNCIAIPEGLLESELFGHEKGSFTGATATKVGKFELASGGTVLLDEIGDMPLTTQAKLLRVLQERQFERVGGNRPISVDLRFIVSTNKNLPEMVREGKFREDLYYRLNVFAMELPPLRERREDIPLLADFFLDKSHDIRISAKAMQMLAGYNWPGNVRELKNVIERASFLTEGGVIGPIELPASITQLYTDRDLSRSTSAKSGLDERLEEIEKGIILEALNRTGGVQVKAAEILGIEQRSLWHRIRKYNIDVGALKKLQKM